MSAEQFIKFVKTLNNALPSAETAAKNLNAALSASKPLKDTDN